MAIFDKEKIYIPASQPSGMTQPVSLIHLYYQFVHPNTARNKQTNRKTVYFYHTLVISYVKLKHYLNPDTDNDVDITLPFCKDEF